TLPDTIKKLLRTEEDLENALIPSDGDGAILETTLQGNEGVLMEQDSEPTGTNVCCVCQEESSGAHTCCICGQIIHAICADNTLETEEGFGSKVTCPRCAQKECMSANKEKAIDGLQAQADTMKKLSNQKFPAVEVGNTVTVPIPSVDRAKGDARNLLCVVTEKTEDGFYKTYNMSDLPLKIVNMTQGELYP
ncbi:unnamed protein product, partial [Acanthoscelides obtectus]